MINSGEFSSFLASVQNRAFKTARYALRDDDLALDAVQDSMIKLAQKYSDRPATEWPMLFQRILQNTVLDQLRHQKVKNTWVTSFTNMLPHYDDDDGTVDPLETLMDALDTGSLYDASRQLERQQLVAMIEEALENLPTRQREAFLLRYWEEMDVAETAEVMGCSEGSVKTHCSRAVASLAKMLKERGLGA
jgi:RNA polymerase sigma-70 factor, ECF subfamily